MKPDAKGNLNQILPSLVRDKDYHEVEGWPKVHVWGNGTVIVEEMKHVLVWDYEGTTPMKWRRYEWAALSEFPKPDRTLHGVEAVGYILWRVDKPKSAWATYPFSSEIGT